MAFAKVLGVKTFFVRSWPVRPTWFRCFALAAFSFTTGSWVTLQLGKTSSVQAETNRVFELRIYHVAPGRLPAVETLFREHVLAMFKRHGITGIGYWNPLDNPESGNTWIYLIAHPSRQEAKKNWDAFAADPEWGQASKAANADGKLVEKIDSTYMDPADISPLR